MSCANQPRLPLEFNLVFLDNRIWHTLKISGDNTSEMMDNIYRTGATGDEDGK